MKNLNISAMFLNVLPIALLEVKRCHPSGSPKVFGLDNVHDVHLPQMGASLLFE
jgi:hypothetical protein